MGEPLVPADVTIPRLPWVPVYVDRLWSSNFFAVATDAEFRAAFCLWLKSWAQRPPGSLPSNDHELCRLAELGADLAKWKKVKRVALRHWIRCDDGRLYHPVVAQLVIEAHEKLSKNRARTASATVAATEARNGRREARRNGLRIVANIDNTENHPPNPPRDGEGDQGFLKNGGSGAAAPPAPIDPKFLNHGDTCMCANCTCWAAQQKMAKL